MKDKVKGVEWQKKPCRREAKKQTKRELEQHQAEIQLRQQEFERQELLRQEDAIFSEMDFFDEIFPSPITAADDAV